jgi:hypothetical protein
VDVLRDKTRQNIFVNWKVLRDDRIGRDAAVLQQVGGLPVGEAIEKVLAEAGGGRVPLGFTRDEGVITISTKEDLSGNTRTRVYDLRDCLPPPGDPNRQAASAALWTEIRRRVAPGTWRDDGGRVGAVRELSGQFIMTQTPQAQHDLLRLLEWMRWRRDLRLHGLKAAPIVLGAMAAVELLQLLRWWKRRARREPGRCGVCGYDLRATPERCPECGDVAAIEEGTAGMVSLKNV